MGNVREESCLRCCVRTVRSSDDVPDVLLTLTWFSERPMKSSDAAVDGVTKAGSSSFTIS